MNDMTVRSARSAPRRARSLLLFVLTGAVSAVLGLAPWLWSGARLPLQNLGEGGVSVEAPIALLPFSQYAVTTIFVLLVVGAAAAGIAARVARTRATGPDHAAQPALWIGLGLLAVQIAALVQTVLVVRAVLRDGAEFALYVAGIAGGSVACVLVGAGAFALIAWAPRGGALVGLTAGAVAMSSWIFVFFRSAVGVEETPVLLLAASPYIAPVLTGAAIAWAGVRTGGRIVAALASLAVMWIAPALFTGLSSALGTRVLARDLPGMLEYGVGVFQMALFIPEPALRPVVATIVVAVLGLVLRRVVTRRRAL